MTLPGICAGSLTPIMEPVIARDALPVSDAKGCCPPAARAPGTVGPGISRVNFAAIAQPCLQRANLPLASIADATGGLAVHAAIADRREELAELCRRHGVVCLEVFGSAARATDFDPLASDADFLVEFGLENGRAPLGQS